ncbi:MAG: cytochrome P460 family protein, partial [Planctomycetaceae bacterium]|nr:cytochrome P460 family protein [Planctomycetaceae bacterium]
MSASPCRGLSIRKFALLTMFAMCAVVAVSTLADEPQPQADAQPAQMAQPEYNEAGALLRPEGYERWTLVGTSVGLDYSKDKEQDAGGEKLGIFHNVYMQPEAFDHYVATGEFPEQTVFVVTNNPPQKRQGDDEISRR